jgi:hypothetical protein
MLFVENLNPGQSNTSEVMADSLPKSAEKVVVSVVRLTDFDRMESS